MGPNRTEMSKENDWRCLSFTVALSNLKCNPNFMIVSGLFGCSTHRVQLNTKEHSKVNALFKGDSNTENK